MAKNSTLENLIHWLSLNKNVNINDILESTGMSRDSLANLRRSGKKDKQVDFIKQLENMYDVDSTRLETSSKSTEIEYIKELKEQIAYLRQDNVQLREENSKLLNKLLEKINN